jgi:hypothetical protein
MVSSMRPSIIIMAAQIEADKDHERVDEKAPDLMVFS